MFALGAGVQMAAPPVNFFGNVTMGFLAVTMPEVFESSLGLPAAGLGLPKIQEPAVSPRPSPPPELENLSIKIQKQMVKRGWTPQEIDRVYREGVPSQVVDRTAGFTPATQYVDPETGKFIVINSQTGNVIQVSKPGFRPNLPVK